MLGNREHETPSMSRAGMLWGPSATMNTVISSSSGWKVSCVGGWEEVGPLAVCVCGPAMPGNRPTPWLVGWRNLTSKPQACSLALPPSSLSLPPPSLPSSSKPPCLSSIVWLQRRREELVERLRGGQKREEAHDLQIGRLKQDRVRVPRTEGEEVRGRKGGRIG